MILQMPHIPKNRLSIIRTLSLALIVNKVFLSISIYLSPVTGFLPSPSRRPTPVEFLAT